jgi:hypothetical protein
MMPKATKNMRNQSLPPFAGRTARKVTSEATAITPHITAINVQSTGFGLRRCSFRSTNLVNLDSAATGVSIPAGTPDYASY